MPIDYSSELPEIPKKSRSRDVKASSPKSSFKIDISQQSKKWTKKDLEAAIELLQSLGLEVHVPTGDEERVKQEASLKLLGFEEASPLPKEPTELVGFLHTTHSVGGNTYGPGELRLSLENSELFRSLLQQDQQCMQHYRDTQQGGPQRFFLIKGRENRRFGRVEVSEGTFNSDKAFEDSVAVTAGKGDMSEGSISNGISF